MQRKKLSILLVLLLLASCTGKPNTNPVAADPLRNVAIQTARLSDATAAATRTTIALAQDGLITAPQERDALLLIRKANDAAGVLKTRLQNLVVLDAGTKTSLLSITNELSLALRDPQTLSLFNIVNPKSRERLQAMIDVIVGVVNALKLSLGGQ